jgi:hypothetical protein
MFELPACDIGQASGFSVREHHIETMALDGWMALRAVRARVAWYGSSIGLSSMSDRRGNREPSDENIRVGTLPTVDEAHHDLDVLWSTRHLKTPTSKRR